MNLLYYHNEINALEIAINCNFIHFFRMYLFFSDFIHFFRFYPFFLDFICFFRYFNTKYCQFELKTSIFFEETFFMRKIVFKRKLISFGRKYFYRKKISSEKKEWKNLHKPLSTSAGMRRLKTLITFSSSSALSLASSALI